MNCSRQKKLRKWKRGLTNDGRLGYITPAKRNQDCSNETKSLQGHGGKSKYGGLIRRRLVSRRRGPAQICSPGCYAVVTIALRKCYDWRVT